MIGMMPLPSCLVPSSDDNEPRDPMAGFLTTLSFPRGGNMKPEGAQYPGQKLFLQHLEQGAHITASYIFACMALSVSPCLGATYTCLL